MRTTTILTAYLLTFFTAAQVGLSIAGSMLLGIVSGFWAMIVTEDRYHE